MKNKVGIIEQIKAATPEEAKKLLLVARGYKHIHPSTLAKCERLVAKKISS